MPRVRLKFKPPEDWLTTVSTEYPDAEFKVLASRPMGDDLLVILEAELSDPMAIRRHFDEAQAHEVRSYEVVHTDEQSLLLQYVVPEPAPHRAGRAAGTLPQYPFLLQNGWVHLELITSHERLSELKTEYEAAGITYQVVSLTQSIDHTDLLTDRQWQFVVEAIENGYYETPRQCSLTDLAAVLGVSKSTASVVLHEAEARIIKEFASDSVE